MTQARRVTTVFLANIGAAAVFPLFLLLFSENVSWSLVWHQFKISFVYANSIGWLAFFVMRRIAPPILRRRRTLAYPILILCLIALALAGSAVANLAFIALGWATAAVVWHSLGFGLKIAISITVVGGILITVYETLKHRLQAATLELRTRQLEEERARKLATEARLSSLESRIHPHFLFNTLNSISSLIREDPGRAERTVERLAALLRYSLDVNASRLVPLSQELKIVHDYLEIESTRFGDRLRYSIDAAESLATLEVPPLTLQTLVENSIKHAIATSRQGGEIRVAASASDGVLVLEVSDDGPGFDLRALKPGHGLENLQDRLAALFDGAARLEIARRDGRMIVSVAVPQRKVIE